MRISDTETLSITATELANSQTDQPTLSVPDMEPQTLAATEIPTLVLSTQSQYTQSVAPGSILHRLLSSPPSAETFTAGPAVNAAAHSEHYPHFPTLNFSETHSKQNEEPLAQ